LAIQDNLSESSFTSVTSKNLVKLIQFLIKAKDELNLANLHKFIMK